MNQFIRHTKGFYTAVFLSLLFCPLSAQEMERKIIIKNNRIYYTTIDKELQMGTLHTGSIAEAFKKNKALAVPAGRNYSSPIIPFCWDLADKNMFAVNFINHSMNFRGKALKLFQVSSLKEWSSTHTIMDMLEVSFEQNVFTNFEPYDFVTERSAVLENFFFDGIALSDSSICMAIANKGELSIWKYEHSKWEHSDPVALPVADYFSLFSYKNKVYMVLSNGKIYSVSTKGINELPEKRLKTMLSEGLLVINKEDNTIQFIKHASLDQTTPFNELLKKNAITIF